MVLEQLPRGKLPHNSKTNPKPNSNPSREAIFFGGNCLVAPNPKTNPDLETNPNPNRGGGAIFLGGGGGGGGGGQLSGHHVKLLSNKNRFFYEIFEKQKAGRCCTQSCFRHTGTGIY